MAEIVSFEIKGLAELQKKMEQLPHDVMKKGLRQALKAGGDLIQNGLVNEAPMDTGFLAEHFNQKTRIMSHDVGGAVFIGPAGHVDYPDKDGGYREKIAKKSGKKYKIGRISVVSVVRYLEFGTSKMTKNPFMTRTFEKMKGAALNAIVDKLRSALASCGTNKTTP